MGLLGVDPTKSNARGEVVFTDVSQDLADGLANPADPFTAQLNSTIGEVGAEQFAPTDATASAFARTRSKLDTDLEDVVFAVVGDSTGSGATRWVRLFVNYLAALYPTKTVVLYDWDVPTNAYTAPTTIQTGTGARTITVYNGSASGQNTTYSQTYLLTMVPVVCDLVFINHGHNMVGTDDTQASQKFYALARDILRWSSPSAALVFIGQNPETPADAGMEAHRTRLVKLAAVCATNGWGFLNLTEVFLANSNWVADWMSDTKHPNDAGSIVMADYIWGLFTNPRIKFAAPVAAPAAFDRIWVPAVQMYPSAVLDTFPKMEMLAGWPTMEFGNASGLISAHASVEIPYSWQQVNVWLYWTVHIAVPGGNIVWDLRFANSFRIGTEIASGSNTVGLNNTQTPISAAPHAVPTVNYGEVHSALLRNATLAPSNDVKATSRIVSLMVRRLASDVADTFADSGNVLGILVERAL